MAANQHYVNPNNIQFIIRELEHRLGKLSTTNGPYWTNWSHGGREVASVCASPYPGPNYGSTAWIRDDLVDIVHGATIPILHSRGLTGTEAHLINARLRAKSHGHKIEHHCLIHEVEQLYDLIVAKGVKEVDKGFGRIYWYTHERLNLKH